MKQIHGLAGIEDGAGNVLDILVDGQHGELKGSRTYHTLDGSDLIAILLSRKIAGDGWDVFFSGSLPILAVCPQRKIRIQSLHRLDAWGKLGRPRDPGVRSRGALAMADRWIGAQMSLGLVPGCGLSAAVERLAPGLRGIRRHGGEEILARERLIRGGRVEVLRTRTDEDIRVWDMRSAYAGAYKDGIPGTFERQSMRAPDSHDCFIAQVTVNIPDGERVPGMPFRRPRDGRLLFPTGRWQTWVCGPEFRALEAAGQIERVYGVALYERIAPYGPMVERLWSLRQTSDDPVVRDYCKLLLVSGYGALSSHTSYPVWHLRPSKPLDDAIVIRPGLLQTWESPKRSLAHGPAAAWILSKVRAKTSSVLREHDGSFYCAVDSVTLPTHVMLPVGDQPGDWHPVHEKTGGIWKAPGVYSLGGGALTRAAGIEREHQAEVMGGASVYVERRRSPACALAHGSCAKQIVSLHLVEDRDLGRIPMDNDAMARTRPLTISEARN